MNGGSSARAAEGSLPDWACVSPQRRAHVARVADLLTSWARVLAPGHMDLWRAAAWLHDALRDADPGELIETVAPEFRSWPGPLLHGPAAAARVQKEDPHAPPALLDAVTFHTVGHARLDTMGRALYLADFLEPGRTFSPVWRAALRARMPARFNDVLREVIASRLTHLVRSGRVLRPETVDFWNRVVTE